MEHWACDYFITKWPIGPRKWLYRLEGSVYLLPIEYSAWAWIIQILIYTPGCSSICGQDNKADRYGYQSVVYFIFHLHALPLGGSY